MSFLLCVKVLGDLCLYFSFASHFFPRLPVLGAALLWAVCAGACSLLRDRGAARFLPLLPSLLAFWMISSWQQGLVLLFPLLYLWALVIAGRFSLDYSRYCDFFPRGTIAVGVLLALSFYGLNWRLTLLYGGVYVLCGIFLLRQLRLGPGKTWQDKAINLASLGLWLAAGAIACVLVWAVLLLRFPLSALLGWVLTIVFAGLLWLAERIDLTLPELKGRQEQDLPLLDLENMFPQFTESGSEGSPVLTAVLTVLGLLILLAVILFVLRRMLGSMTKKAPRSPRWSDAERISAGTISRSLGLSSRDRLRRNYRKFLLLSKSRGAQLTSAQTTGEQVAYSAGTVDSGAARRLRELYLPARYSVDHEISPQALREAKDLLRAMEKKQNDQ